MTEADLTDDPTGEDPLTLGVALYDHYEQGDEVKAYFGLLAIYALARLATDAGDEATLDRVERILRRFPDEVEHPRYNFPSYRIGGIAQSFMIAQGRMADRRPMLREYADEMMRAPRDPAGIVTMGAHGDLIWIDAAMATTPFLLYAGQVLGERRYIEEAVNQAVLMYDELLDREVGLLHQCRGFVGPGLRSEDHWSRGNGWGYFALAELVRELAADDPRRPEVEERFVALSHALLAHQGPRGLWRQEIPLESAWDESSGTGLILYGFGVGIRSGLLAGDRWAHALRTGLHGLVSHCVNPDHSIENSCPGNLCPGEGAAKGTVDAYVTIPVPHRDEPHGCAPLILAMTAAETVGVTALELRRAPQESTYLGGLASGGGAR
ncbi:glycoside hydrolase family 88 protein [Streptomyces rubiginosohelvolus]|uniref:glycoside hydrolase family 88 protein n=1 Tax=Streptomyces rubiginosohelvolus TaxID=67362 RepID=UPI0036D9594B